MKTIDPHELVELVGAENGQIGSIFEGTHRKAFELANSISEYDERREGPNEGEVYCHAINWQSPAYNMPARDRYVRFSNENTAPFLFDIVSLHPEDEPEKVIPSRVHVYGLKGRPDVELSQGNNGLITVDRGTQFESLGRIVRHREVRDHRPTTEITNLRKSDRERVITVVTDVLGALATTRCLASLYEASLLLPSEEERLQAVRTAAADVFLLRSLGTNTSFRS